MRIHRVAAVLTAVVAVSVPSVMPAYAQPPNDTPAGATVIGSLPFDDSVVIDDATTDALDATLNEQCGAPATEGSVWYRFDATADGALIFDVSGSSFTAGALVTLGDPTNANVLTCGPDAVVFEVAAGQSYFIMAFSDTPGVTTGTLVVHAEEAPPPPQVDVTVNPTGTFTRAGSALISGTFTCTGEDVEFAFVDVQLAQRVGRFTIIGFGSIDAICDGGTHPWTVEVFADNGQFRGGHSMTFTFGVACGPFICGEDFEEQTVMLRRR
jgi:Family of unknown function (DUF6299)